MNNLKDIRSIAFAGSGNVAWHLARHLYHKGFLISGIWSRNEDHASELASKCNSVYCKDLSDLKDVADLIIIAVADKAIEEVIQNLEGFDGIVVHTAGSVSIDLFHDRFQNYGSLYPLQTFSKEIQINFENVPFLLEASDNVVLDKIKSIALNFSERIYEVDSNKRQLIHIAAVFAGNYSNLMYTISSKLLNSVGLPDDILNSLILETARKATSSNPIMVQTGPARRMDYSTIEKHILALKLQPEYEHLYDVLAQAIINQYK